MTKRTTGPATKRSDFVDGESYAGALWHDGISREHIASGRGFGLGHHADRLTAIWGNNPDQTLEYEASFMPALPHTFQKKYTFSQRGRKKKSL